MEYKELPRTILYNSSTAAKILYLVKELLRSKMGYKELPRTHLYNSVTATDFLPYSAIQNFVSDNYLQASGVLWEETGEAGCTIHPEDAACNDIADCIIPEPHICKLSENRLILNICL